MMRWVVQVRGESGGQGRAMHEESRDADRERLERRLNGRATDCDSP